ncbi:MAG: hypothetical protein JNM58_01810 [Xanthomonadaceae bacterium]|nr:hypothetical protein [Xanthomonadaceae bacterium]
MSTPDAIVRHPLLSGTQRVAALWFDAERLPEAVRAQRILSAWRTGAQALRFAEGDLLRFPADVTLRCADAPGEALCRFDGDRLGSAPLSRAERADIGDADLVIVRNARTHGLRLRDGIALDPSRWIDTGEYTLHDTYDCSDPTPPIRVGALEGKSARTVFGDKVPGAAPEREGLMRAFAALRGNARDAQGGRQGSGSGVAGWLAGAAAKAAQALQPRGSAPARPSALREAMTRLALATRVSSLIGRKQAAYLQRMMRHFDDGDLNEALRHAIPLNGSGPSLGQAFSTPGRRDSLNFSQGVGGSYDIHVPDDLQTHLQRVYRQAFERLDKLGRIDEAAFVLAELLNARQECLDYLERHGRARQAADLALGWDMPVATCTRLLLLGGDWSRAVLLARRENAFAAVVPQLEKKDPALALKLRIAWGETLADQGEWLAAVDAVWPVPQARNLAIEWLRTAERAGETLSARALVRRAALLPDTLDDYRERIEALSDPATGPDVRDAVARALLDAAASSDALSEMALRILPALAADRAESLNNLDAAQLQRLLTRANDPALAADVPAWRTPQASTTTSHWTTAATAPWSAPAAGLHAIEDAVPLPRRRYLVALGESGLAVIDQNGRALHRYPVPCHRIVIADNGAIALAVAGREQAVRVTRIDLDRQAATDLGTLVLQHFAPRFDGIGWSIVADGRILVLDTAKSLREVLWHVGDLPGPVVASRHTASHELHLIRSGNIFQLWSYALPARKMIARDMVQPDPERRLLLVPPSGVLEGNLHRSADGALFVDFAKGAASPPGIAWQAPAQAPSNSYGAVQLSIGASSPQGNRRMPLDPAHTLAHVDLQHTLHGLWLAAMITDGDRPLATRINIYRHDDGLCVQTGDWPADAAPRVREHGDGLLVFDARGRLLDLSPKRATPIAISML